MTSLLFVDDEPLVLDGLKRMLRSQRNEWQMDFATSGAEALAIMDGKRFDVVVSDMRMPGMDGAEFLNHVAHRFPGTVRIVLSGQAEKDRVLRLLGGCHQYLSKPREPDILKSTVLAGLPTARPPPNDPLKQAIANVNVIASDPQLYSQLVDELLKDDPSLTQLGHIVEQDIGMTAKVMQLVSTNFFGQPRRVRSAAEAVWNRSVSI
ncbi:MAG: response regulator [Pirellulaceae bacterium]